MFSKANRGQCAVEYFLVFAAIAVFTLLSITMFYPRVHQASETAFQAAIEDIASGGKRATTPQRPPRRGFFGRRLPQQPPARRFFGRG